MLMRYSLAWFEVGNRISELVTVMLLLLLLLIITIIIIPGEQIGTSEK